MSTLRLFAPFLLPAAILACGRMAFPVVRRCAIRANPFLTEVTILWCYTVAIMALMMSLMIWLHA